MGTYYDYAKDLHQLANMLEYADELPLPRYPGQGLGIDIHVDSPDDVDKVAIAFDMKVDRHNGHTTAELTVGTVQMRFVHIEDAAMAQYEARMAYARTMPDPDPAPWAARDLAHLAAGPDPLVVT